MYKMKKEGKNMNYANQFGYSDVSPCEVVKVISEKTRELSLLKAGQEKAEIVIFDDGLQEKTIN